MPSTAALAHRDSVSSDAADSVPFGGATSISGWLFRPDSGLPSALLVAIPGGKYGKDYWHLEIDGHDGYSFAEDCVRAGFAVLAIDNLGTGDSTRPAGGDAAGLPEMAAANAAATVAARRMVAGVAVIGIASPWAWPSSCCSRRRTAVSPSCSGTGCVPGSSACSPCPPLETKADS